MSLIGAYEGSFIYGHGIALVTTNDTAVELIMTNATINFSFDPDTCSVDR